MRALIIFSGLVIFLIGCNSSKNEQAVISGQLKNAANMKVYVERITAEGDVPADSAVTDAHGKFTVKNPADELDYYLLRTGDRQIAYLVLKGGETVTVTGDAKDLEHTYEVEGSEDTRLLLRLKRFDYHLSDSMNKVYSAFRNENPFQKDSLGAILQAEYDSLLRQFSINLIRENFTSLVSLSATQYLDRQKDFHLFEQLNDSLRKAARGNRYVAVFSRQVEDMKKLPLGSLAPEIRLTSPEGKEVTLSSLKGKIVVIDFWASWCGPCRREMPHMVSLYKNFKESGLEIFGVSLDDNADAWKSAIAQDQMQWIQVSELKKWDSEVVATYGVEEIPHTVLLDREGKIVEKGLDPHALQIKIQELLALENKKIN